MKPINEETFLKIVIALMAIYFNSFNNFGAILTMLCWFSVRKIELFDENIFSQSENLLLNVFETGYCNCKKLEITA